MHALYVPYSTSAVVTFFPSINIKERESFALYETRSSGDYKIARLAVATATHTPHAYRDAAFSAACGENEGNTWHVWRPHTHARARRLDMIGRMGSSRRRTFIDACMRVAAVVLPTRACDLHLIHPSLVPSSRP